MNVGQRIRQLRTKNNLTQEELASRCELTKGYLSQLENDLATPSLPTLQDIVVALGTNMSQFFKEDERQEKVTFEEDDVYNQADGTGFVNLFGLPLKVRALMQEKTGLLK